MDNSKWQTKGESLFRRWVYYPKNVLCIILTTSVSVCNMLMTFCGRGLLVGMTSRSWQWAVLLLAQLLNTKMLLTIFLQYGSLYSNVTCSNLKLFVLMRVYSSVLVQLHILGMWRELRCHRRSAYQKITKHFFRKPSRFSFL